MAASVSSPADVVNLTLARIGYDGRVGSLYDGSRAAKAALTVYAQTRDAVLRETTWDFAQKIIANPAVTGAVPPWPWVWEYAYPADCLLVRSVYNAVEMADPNNPIPTQWTVGDGASGKVVWSKLATSIIVYTAQVTNPAQWDALFVETVAAALGRRLAPLLAKDGGVKMAAEDEKASTTIAAGIDG